jgi:hypothetical protein
MIVLALFVPMVVITLLYGRAWFTHREARRKGAMTWAWNAANLGPDRSRLATGVTELDEKPTSDLQPVSIYGFSVPLPLSSVVAVRLNRFGRNSLTIKLDERRLMLIFLPNSVFEDIGAVDMELLRAIGDAQYPGWFSSIHPEEVTKQYARYLVKGLFGAPPRQLFRNRRLFGMLSPQRVSIAGSQGVLQFMLGAEHGGPAGEDPMVLSIASASGYSERPGPARPTQAASRLGDAPNDPRLCIEAAAAGVAAETLSTSCGQLIELP